ncbi:TetR/AcrR family transcriptional regulator [Nocardia jejuensis]|uniref:TetR/AcrR family transcriptional regulator n=1 Tax=Nocardia jejuensis TaxID=328049 RepID=UPI00082B4BE1|nr:TetR/AcrR family transcriptional regulator [Nocardia jejuensis]
MSERREHILDAARSLIVRDGYAGASMHAIARAAGVTRPSLYSEFTDREDLFAALWDREEDRVLTMSAAATPDVPPGADPVEIAQQSVDVFVDLVLSAPETWRLVLMAGDGMPPSTHDRIERGRESIRERVQLVLNVVTALGDRDDVDTELLGHGVISASETAARLLVGDGGVSREAVIGTLRWMTRRALVMAGVLAATTAGKG